jgi:hypothetical protein
MLPVHSDLFLYVMRKRNNRLFLRGIKIKVRLFLSLQWKRRGEGVLFCGFGSSGTAELVELCGILFLSGLKALEKRADTR